MRKLLISFAILTVLIVLGSSGGFAQSAVKSGPDSSTVRDPEVEKDSMTNLEKARFYFNSRKAYKASLARCLETLAGDPGFSKIDEVLYIAGESSLRLSAGKGKQKPSDPVDQLRLDAKEYLSRLVKDHPDSKFKKSAEDDLKQLADVAKAPVGK